MTKADAREGQEGVVPARSALVDLVVIVRQRDLDRLPGFLRSLKAQSIGWNRLHLKFWLPGACEQTVGSLRAVLARHGHGQAPVVLQDHFCTASALFDAGHAPWLAIRYAAVPLPPGHFSDLLDAAGSIGAARADLLLCGSEVGSGAGDGGGFVDAALIGYRCLMSRAAIHGLPSRLERPLAADHLADVLAWQLMQGPNVVSGSARADGLPMVGLAEPDASAWREPERYDASLRAGLLAVLDQASADGPAPTWLQRAVLRHLHWYLTVDGRERAPTVVVDKDLAERFHSVVSALMSGIDAQTLAALTDPAMTVEIRHALMSYHRRTACFSPAVDAFDHAQGLARVTYWIHGEPPSEQFELDGLPVQPAYQKYRSCNYFRKTLLRQRMAWVKLDGAKTLQLRLAGQPVALAIGEAGFSLAAPPGGAPPLALDGLPTRFAQGKRGQRPLPSGWRGWRVRLLKALARLPWVRDAYRDAWVLIDREEYADDSAEHLYRWLRENHPEVNAWFLLRRDSADWPRLAQEGFRLVTPGLRRKLLLLNSAHVISSHTDLYMGGFDRRLYGDSMHWRFTFLQHGVIKDDLSHWLNPCEFDAFVTSSPAEHASVVADDTPYPYTDREVRRTGLPRHDRLLRYAAETPPEQVNVLLIMPTWRGSLVDDRAQGSEAQRNEVFARSEYATRWRELLASPRLHDLARRAGLQMAFMPHPNALPYVSAFGLPEQVMLVTADTMQVQKVFVRTKVFITDYTSVAFTMALLRRAVLYYQFDRNHFYGGSHNWREGYFDYGRDGFGPVAEDAGHLLDELQRLAAQGMDPEPGYRARMVQAMPDTDQNACQRTFDAIRSLNQPGAQAAPRPDAAAAGSGTPLPARAVALHR